jgi:phosphatidylglycerol:prolipoprotein diacylglycerol transferase
VHRVLLFGGTPYAIFSYGVMLTLAVLAGVVLLLRRGRARGYHSDTMLDFAMALLLGGLVGARAVSVWEDWSVYAANPIEILNIRGGGLSWHGSIIGGLLGILWFARRNRLQMLGLLDLVSPSLALGHAIGRIGCFLNGCCEGRPTTVPWAFTFPDAIELKPPFVPRHPTQLYELFGELIILAVLLRFERKARPAGTLFYLYLVLYAVLRFVVEFFREEPLLAGGLDLAQYASIVMIVVCLPLLTRRPSQPIVDNAAPAAPLPSNA